MTSSCIRLVWQPIQHKDRQRAESGETDSWVAANRQGGPTRLDEIKNFHAQIPTGRVGRRAANHGPIDSSGYRTNEGIYLISDDRQLSRASEGQGRRLLSTRSSRRYEPPPYN